MRSLLLLPILVAGLASAAPAQTDAGNDFTPGDKVIYVDNFARVPLGMLPRNLKVNGGNMEVAKVGDRAVLRVTSDPTSFTIGLGTLLPERFTIEFEIYVPDALGWDQEVYLAPPPTENTAAFISYWGNQAGIFDRTSEDWKEYRSNIPRAQVEVEEEEEEGERPPVWDRVQVMGDGNFIKVYVNGTRVANVPSVNLGRSNALYFNTRGDQKYPVLLANFRVAGGGKDLYRALMEDGQLTLEGIEFDTNSDILRPAADSVLRQVATALKDKADLVVLVQGHTDNVGNAAANQALSERRARAVVARLVALGMPAAQLKAEGKGAAEPIASNETAEGRQRNRRVMLLRDY